MQKYTKTLLVLAVLFVARNAHAGYYNSYSDSLSTIVTSSATASGGQGLVTLSTPTTPSTSSSGYYNYISHIHIEMYAVSTLTGGATPVNCTTTNLPTTPVFKFQTAEATGTEQTLDMDFAYPIQANQGFQVVITCPATSNVIWNMVVTYYQGR